MLNSTESVVKALIISGLTPTVELEALQAKFDGQLNIIEMTNGKLAIYPEEGIRGRFEELVAACWDLQLQSIDLRRAA